MPPIEIVKSIALFVVAGICEIGGGYLVWLWLRDRELVRAPAGDLSGDLRDLEDARAEVDGIAGRAKPYLGLRAASLILVTDSARAGTCDRSSAGTPVKTESQTGSLQESKNPPLIS